MLVLASDLALPQFWFLKKLLLVQGHWYYRRVGYLVLSASTAMLSLFNYIMVCIGFFGSYSLNDFSFSFFVQCKLCMFIWLTVIWFLMLLGRNMSWKVFLPNHMHLIEIYEKYFIHIWMLTFVYKLSFYGRLIFQLQEILVQICPYHFSWCFGQNLSHKTLLQHKKLYGYNMQYSWSKHFGQALFCSTISPIQLIYGAWIIGY